MTHLTRISRSNERVSSLRTAHLALRPAHLVVAGLFAAAVSAQAGFVTWSSAQTISDDSDVSTAGTLVVAHNLGTFGNASATVNGVTFTPFATSTTSNTLGDVTLSAATPILGNNTDFGEINPPFSLLSPGYQTLLQSGSFTTSAATPASISMTLAGLTPGAQYQFQWWAHESEVSSFNPLAPPPGLPATTATSGNSVTLERRGVSPGSVGQFALGVFTATSTSQSIDFSGSDTKTLLSAFQLRQIAAPAIPEPGTALFGVAMLGVAFRSVSKRRR